MPGELTPHSLALCKAELQSIGQTEQVKAHGSQKNVIVLNHVNLLVLDHF